MDFRASQEARVAAALPTSSSVSAKSGAAEDGAVMFPKAPKIGTLLRKSRFRWLGPGGLKFELRVTAT